MGVKDWVYLNQICKLIYPGAEITCKGDPKFAKLPTIIYSCKFLIIYSCKFLISADIAKNTAAKKSKDTFSAGYIFRKGGG